MLDSLGYCVFIQNIITGTLQADVVVLVINFCLSGFEASIYEEIHNFEHFLLVYTLGVKKMIYVMNNMDNKAVKYSEAQYKEIEIEFFA